MATVDELIQSLQDAATSALESAQEAATNAVFGGLSGGSVELTSHVDVPYIEPPPPPPMENLLPLFDAGYASSFNQIEPWIEPLFDKWAAKYFQQVPPQLYQDTEEVMGRMLAGETGITPEVEQALWNRARDREQDALASSRDTAYTQFAARGFSMPDGFLAQVLENFERAALERDAAVSREITIKNFDLLSDHIKFAVSESNRLRLGMASSFATLFKTFLDIPELGIKIGISRVEAGTKLYEMISAYYDALIKIEALKLDAAKALDASDVFEMGQKVEQFKAESASRVHGSVGAAEAMGRAAGAALGALNTLVAKTENTEV